MVTPSVCHTGQVYSNVEKPSAPGSKPETDFLEV
jgi:hypothetical protein